MRLPRLLFVVIISLVPHFTLSIHDDFCSHNGGETSTETSRRPSPEELLAGTQGKPIEEFTTCEEFVSSFLNRKPGIVRGRGTPSSFSSELDDFVRAVSPAELQKSGLSILLGTANSYTGREFRATTLGSHVSAVLRREAKETTTAAAAEGRGEPWNVLGNETYYLFGNHVGKEWEEFLARYPPVQRRPEFACAFADAGERQSHHHQQFTASFGLSGRYEGVPFHYHGHGFLEVLWGGKKWLTFEDEPGGEAAFFDPNITSSHFYITSPSRLLASLYEANLHTGDVIYFPPRWPHATLNLEAYNVWISTFA